MGKIVVHAGDFLDRVGHFDFGWFSLKTKKNPFLGESISVAQLEALEIASEENVKKLGGTVGWGAVGALVLGPIGLLAGLMLGGKKKEVTFVARFKDGRRLLATTDNATFIELQAAVF